MKLYHIGPSGTFCESLPPLFAIVLQGQQGVACLDALARVNNGLAENSLPQPAERDKMMARRKGCGSIFARDQWPVPRWNRPCGQAFGLRFATLAAAAGTAGLRPRPEDLANAERVAE